MPSFQDADRWLTQLMGLGPDQTPFPWQRELLRRFLGGEMVGRIDVPTGLGKTAVMAVWLAARAAGAEVPRRLVYVVDRRAVVDQATDVAERLRQVVDEDAELKAALGLGNRRLPISTLRGLHVDNREWLEDPAAPAVVVGTVDMVGSRLLFEGYGVSRKMRPYHAGLLGAGVLVALDEAHLVPPFEQLLRSIAEGSEEFGPKPELRALIPPFRLLALTATGRTGQGTVLSLAYEDGQHPEVAARLHARKRLRFETVSDRAGKGEEERLADALAEQAWALRDQDGAALRILVFSDRRQVAEMAKSKVEERSERETRLSDSARRDDGALFVGGRRVLEREQAKARLIDMGFLAGSAVARDRPKFVFATSAAEVGVDLDADHMVCDLVAWERMVQRLGRVNRRGKGDARVVVLLEPEPSPNKKEREALDKRTQREELKKGQVKLADAFEARRRSWQDYQRPFRHLTREDGGLDVSPGALAALRRRSEADAELGTDLERATTPAPLRPALNRALVDAWSLTSLERHTGRPSVEPWLRGWLEEEPQTAVIWRTHLPVPAAREVRSKDVEAFFEAAPPHASELLERETYAVGEWLLKRARAVRQRGSQADNDVATLGPADVVALALSPAGDLRRAYSLRELRDESQDASRDLRRELPGATLVVDARLGGLSADGLLDAAVDSIPATVDGGQTWLEPGVVRFRVRALAPEEATTTPASGPWRERLRVVIERSDEGEPTRRLLVEKWRHDAATEDDRSASRPQLLDDHQAHVERRVRELATRLGLPAEYVEVLALAARLHDEGKRARRWQQAFRAPTDAPYAKTRGPIMLARLDGYRHEFGSLLALRGDQRLLSLGDELRDLALHLIVAHHGHARPLIGTQGCETGPPSALEEHARDVALRFARQQRRWGPWGLAWWEALLRAADQAASRDNDAADEPEVR